MLDWVWCKGIDRDQGVTLEDPSTEADFGEPAPQVQLRLAKFLDSSRTRCGPLPGNNLGSKLLQSFEFLNIRYVLGVPDASTIPKD